MSRRTATINQIRAFLIEQGITVRKGLRALRNSFEAILEERKGEISPRMRSILIGLYGDWVWMDDRIDKVSAEIEEISRTEENCVNVMSVPGMSIYTLADPYFEQLKEMKSANSQALEATQRLVEAASDADLMQALNAGA